MQLLVVRHVTFRTVLDYLRYNCYQITLLVFLRLVDPSSYLTLTIVHLLPTLYQRSWLHHLFNILPHVCRTYL